MNILQLISFLWRRKPAVEPEPVDDNVYDDATGELLLSRGQAEAFLDVELPWGVWKRRGDFPHAKVVDGAMYYSARALHKWAVLDEASLVYDDESLYHDDTEK